jgi:hypothetical protein
VQKLAEGILEFGPSPAPEARPLPDRERLLGPGILRFALNDIERGMRIKATGKVVSGVDKKILFSRVDAEQSKLKIK